MIYYLTFFITAIIIDFKDLKNSDKKAEVIFYIVTMLFVLGLAIYYYLNTNRIGIAEYILNLFRLGEK